MSSVSELSDASSVASVEEEGEKGEEGKQQSTGSERCVALSMPLRACSKGTPHCDLCRIHQAGFVRQDAKLRQGGVGELNLDISHTF
eukprot:7038994-Pyramimonas_sp.AAC.1